jgi:hypothetical protein
MTALLQEGPLPTSDAPEPEPGTDTVVDLGRVGPGGEVPGEGHHVAGLAAEVELLAHRAGQFLDDAHGVGHLAQRAEPAEADGQHAQEAQVPLRPAPQVGTAHLDHDVGPVVQPGAVHLRDGRRGERGRRWREGPAGAGDGDHAVPAQDGDDLGQAPDVTSTSSTTGSTRPRPALA